MHTPNFFSTPVFPRRFEIQKSFTGSAANIYISHDTWVLKVYRDELANAYVIAHQERELYIRANEDVAPFFVEYCRYFGGCLEICREDDAGAKVALVMPYLGLDLIEDFRRTLSSKSRECDTFKILGLFFKRLVELIDKKIIHLDIKPDNIFVRRDSYGGIIDVRIGDMGMSTRLIGDEEYIRLADAGYCGTAFYIPFSMAATATAQIKSYRTGHGIDLMGALITTLELLFYTDSDLRGKIKQFHAECNSLLLEENPFAAKAEIIRKSREMLLGYVSVRKVEDIFPLSLVEEKFQGILIDRFEFIKSNILSVCDFSAEQNWIMMHACEAKRFAMKMMCVCAEIEGCLNNSPKLMYRPTAELDRAGLHI